jgi:hypothetical protein
MEKLVTIYQLAEETGLTVRNLRTLVSKGILPTFRTGYRSWWSQPSKVAKALERFEIKPAFDRFDRKAGK